MTTTKDTTRASHSATPSDTDPDGVARRMLAGVADVSAEVRDHVGELAGATSAVVAGADTKVQEASDQSLIMVAGMSVGFAMGLLAGGSNRILVAAVLAPAALIAVRLLERVGGMDDGSRGGVARRGAGSR